MCIGFMQNEAGLMQSIYPKSASTDHVSGYILCGTNLSIFFVLSLFTCDSLTCMSIFHHYLMYRVLISLNVKKKKL